MLSGTLMTLTILVLSECSKEEGNPQTFLDRCEPNSYVILGCNVCRCDGKGKIIKELCTKRACENRRVHIEESRRTYNVNGSCEPGNWYSAEPCQLCYCVHKNKLVCNSNSDQTKLVLGKFDFTVCGSNLLEEASQITEGKYLQRIRKKKRPKRVTRKIRKGRAGRTTTTTTEGSYTDELYQDILKNSKRRNKNTLNIGRNDNNKDESDNDSDDEDEDVYYSQKQVGLTILPYDDSHESYYRKERSVSVKTDTDFSQKLATGAQNKINNKVAKPFADFNIPQILSKVLSMAMRKSMVLLDDKKQCTKPGITYSSGCNKCFCLKNGKILCTKQLCK